MATVAFEVKLREVKLAHETQYDMTVYEVRRRRRGVDKQIYPFGDFDGRCANLDAVGFVLGEVIPEAMLQAGE